MNDKLQDTLSILAAKLGTSAERLWPVIVAKERMDWFAAAAVGIFLFVIACIAWRVSWVFAEKEPHEWGWDITENAWPILATILSIAALIAMGIAFGNIGVLVYPEAAAVTEILHGTGH